MESLFSLVSTISFKALRLVFSGICLLVVLYTGVHYSQKGPHVSSQERSWSTFFIPGEMDETKVVIEEKLERDFAPILEAGNGERREEGDIDVPVPKPDYELEVCSQAPVSSTLKSSETTSTPPKDQVGILVTAELDRALKECKERVERIVKDCRAHNRKFRDIEFDLENDKVRTHFGLYSDGSERPPDVKRVTDIFENPKFFVDGPHSNDIAQGSLGDCWFLSALSTISTSPDLIHKCCVARDETVGIYGFIFFRDGRWVNVVIDDQLFWSLPKFEELSKEEQELYHEDRDLYNSMAKKGGKGLRFAKSGTAGETWVPLIEKAYAKLHGDFTSLAGGSMSEGVEDLTGGVSIMIKVADILDPDQFWTEELLHANNHSRLFGVSFPGLSEVRSGSNDRTVRGLFGSHAYSILRVKECGGKRFVVLRNPWGNSEWTGRWSDGSEEWTSDWIWALKELEHVLGDDGEFVMEYSDFLDTWSLIQRTTIFDSTWVMSSHWLRAPPQRPIHPWTYGDITFNFTLTKQSTTLIVLSQLDARYFKYIDGISWWNIEFVVYKRGERDMVAQSYAGTFYQRSVSCEMDLEAGEYVVYPRLERYPLQTSGYFQEGAKVWEKRKLGRVLTQRTTARAIASNYDLQAQKFVPQHLEAAIKTDYAESKAGKLELTEKAKEKEEEEGNIISSTTTTTISTTTVVVEEKTTSKSKAIPPKGTATPATSQTKTANTDTSLARDNITSQLPVTIEVPPSDNLPQKGYLIITDADWEPVGAAIPFGGVDDDQEGGPEDKVDSSGVDDPADVSATEPGKVETGEDEDAHTVFVGLRVYTKKDVVVVVTGKTTERDPSA